MRDYDITTLGDVSAYIDSIQNRVLNYRDIGVKRYSVALDNHNPTRDYGSGYVVKYAHDNVDTGYVLFHDGQFGDNRKLAFLIDDGTTIRPFYLASWNESGGFFILHPITPNWGPQFGPRKMYHVMVSDKICD